MSFALRKEISVIYQNCFRPFGFSPVIKSEEKRQQRIYQYLLADSSFTSVVTRDLTLLSLREDFTRCDRSPDGKAVS